jgi:hypothetical protein
MKKTDKNENLIFTEPLSNKYDDTQQKKQKIICHSTVKVIYK